MRISVGRADGWSRSSRGAPISSTRSTLILAATCPRFRPTTTTRSFRKGFATICSWRNGARVLFTAIAVKSTLAPFRHEQIVAKPFRKERVVVVGLTRGHVAAKIRVERVEEIGAPRLLLDQPSARPTEIRMRSDVQQAARDVFVRQTLMVIVVAEKIPIPIEREPATIAKPTGYGCENLAVGRDSS